MSAAGPRIDVELVRQERHQLHIDASRRSARAGPGPVKFPELASHGGMRSKIPLRGRRRHLRQG
jgi:hypothetical protein